MLSHDTVAALALVILFLPLASFTVQIFSWKRLPRQGDWLPTSTMAVCLALAVALFANMQAAHDPAFRVAASTTWFRVAGVPAISMGLVVDNLTCVMLLVVTLVSFLVHLFSTGYMHGDPRYGRYFAFLSLFSFSMLGIVLSDNLMALYIFWELVGLSSYLLIGFWFEKDSAAQACKKAFLTTRVGDVGMFLGIMILYLNLGTFNLAEIFHRLPEAGAWATTEFLGLPLLTWAGIGLFCGAIGKSAQFPLHVWLPDAMEGPTPVSALIHAATMVAAGVYLTARICPLLTPAALTFVAVIGLTTAFLAATIALVQNDIKKVLAYSTISQLGYMIMALGLGGYGAGLMHLTTHAMFKACLFLGSGSVIHALHSQDLREMGGLRRKLPLTFATFLIATLAIAGIWPFSGFFSKDAVLAQTLASFLEHRDWHLVFPVVGFLVAAMTAFYMFRLVFLAFTGSPRDAHKHDHAHESPPAMAAPLMVLATLSFGFWYLGWFEHLIASPATALPEALRAAQDLSAGAAQALHEHAHHLAVLLSSIVAVSGIALAFLFYVLMPELPGRVVGAFPTVHRFLSDKWRFDDLYRHVPVMLTLHVSALCARFDRAVDWVVNAFGAAAKTLSVWAGVLDRDLVDAAVNGIAERVKELARTARSFQTGQLQTYATFLALGALALVILQVALTDSSFELPHLLQGWSLSEGLNLVWRP